ncbi:MAG: hypothetical protein QOH50_402 [Kribbellaceae bacterium]|jgi:hypothetical protein|nr:hypothetical protein [Kribbellaceae bacterium]
MATEQWLKMDAGSEYNPHWERYFSCHEEDRVTELAEELVPMAQELDSAIAWRDSSNERNAWIVLVLHKRVNKTVRVVQKDASGRPYIETVLPWSKYIDKTAAEQRDIILERVDLVFKALLEKMAS